jgi:hypothetical protein
MRTSGARCSVLALALLLAAPIQLAAANRFWVENKELRIGPTGQTISIYCDNDFPVYAFTATLKFDQAKIQVTGLNWGASVGTPEWPDLKYDNGTGDITVAAVLDLSPHKDATDKVIATGTSHAILTITLNVLATTTTTSLFDIRDHSPRADGVEIKNVLTDSTAKSFFPLQEDRTVTLRDLTPSIASFAANTGKAGKEFYMSVDNVDLPGLTISVKVCGKTLVRDAADGFALLEDNRTLSCVAPSCGTIGWAPVVVTTDYGSDTEANGFNYEQSFAPAITGIANNAGNAGKVFQVTGTNFDRASLTVKVGGTTAAATLRANKTTIDVTAPAGGPGWKAVQVCTVEGCDSEAQGFDYVGTLFVRGDSNGDGNVDLADAIAIFADLFLGEPARNPCRDALDSDDTGLLDLTDGVKVLQFLFMGGIQPPPPFPAAGTDPTADSLPTC